MTPTDTRAPMAAAPMVYNDDNSVAWERMWTSFCTLASAGGPPHRGTLLRAQTDADVTCDAYIQVVQETVRGVRLVSGLEARPDEAGWIAVRCTSAAQACWLATQIQAENVESRWAGHDLFVPAGDTFTLKHEVKNVITAVAKTTHYWSDHLAAPLKQALGWEAAWQQSKRTMGQWLGRRHGSPGIAAER